MSSIAFDGLLLLDAPVLLPHHRWTRTRTNFQPLYLCHLFDTSTDSQDTNEIALDPSSFTPPQLFFTRQDRIQAPLLHLAQF